MADKKPSEATVKVGGVDDIERIEKVTKQLLDEVQKIGKTFDSLPKSIKKSLDQLKSFQTSSANSSLSDFEKKQKIINDGLIRVRKESIELTKEANLELSKYQRIIEQEHAEHVKQNKLLIEERELKKEEIKTKRQQMRMIQSMVNLGGGTGQGGLLGAAMGMFSGGIGLGAGSGTNKLGSLFSKAGEKMINYQQQARGAAFSRDAISGQQASSKQKEFAMRHPRLSKIMYGEEGSRGGGIVGAGGGIMKSLGGLSGGLAGFAAGGISAIISKGLESSPMFQAISKIMNQAFSLILRPIGDFMGAILKPIAVPLMKWAAINAREMAINGKETFKTASLIGKSLVVFFSNPLAFINDIAASIGDAIMNRGFTLESRVNTRYDAIITGLDDKLKSLGFGGLSGKISGAQTKSGIITNPQLTIPPALETAMEKNTKAIEANTEAMAKQTEKATTILTNIATGQEPVKGLTEPGEVAVTRGFSQDTQDFFNKYPIKPDNTNPEFGKYPPQIEKNIKDTEKINKAHQEKNKKQLESIEKATVKTRVYENDMASLLEAHKLAVQVGNKKLADILKEEIEAKLAEHGDYLNKAQIKAQLSQQELELHRNIALNTQLSAEVITAAYERLQSILKSITNMSTKSATNPSGISVSVKKEVEAAIEAGKSQPAKAVTTSARSEMQTAQSLGLGYDAREGATSEYSLYKGYMAEGQMSSNVAKFVAKTVMKSRGAYANTEQITSMWANYMKVPESSRLSKAERDAFEGLGWARPNTFNNIAHNAAIYAKNILKYASGGMINEPVFGFGQNTGKGYLLGERGPEMVTPIGKSGMNYVINLSINIDKMSKDIDLNNIKPIVERALLEAHARRGII